jgi:hypothetical protein
VVDPVGRLRAPQEVVWSDADFVRFTRSTVADLRAAYARYPGEPGIDSLVTEMLALSPRFAEMWAEHAVEVRGAETGQRLIAYCAAPGSATEAAFAELVHRAPMPG